MHLGRLFLRYYIFFSFEIDVVLSPFKFFSVLFVFKLGVSRRNRKMYSLSHLLTLMIMYE